MCLFVHCNPHLFPSFVCVRILQNVCTILRRVHAIMPVCVCACARARACGACLDSHKVKRRHLYSCLRPRRDRAPHFVFDTNAHKTRSHFINNDSSFRLFRFPSPLLCTSRTSTCIIVIIKTKVCLYSRRLSRRVPTSKPFPGRNGDIFTDMKCFA